MLTITKNLYEFDDLSDEAKEKAFDIWSRDEYYDNTDCRDTLYKAAEMFNFEVRNWEVDFCGCDIRYSGNWSDEIGELHGARLLAYVWNNCRSLWQFKYYSKCCVGSSDYHSRRSRFARELTGYDLTGFWCDDAVSSAVEALWSNFRRNYTYSDLVSDIISNLEKYWQKDYSYHFSLEYFADFADANELVFTADGAECYSKSEADKVTA